MRILALAVLAAIIVVSGIWLARDRSAVDDSGGASPVSAEASQETAAPPAGDPSATEEGAEEGVEEGAAEAEAESGALPAGYTQVEYTADAPQRQFEAPEQVLDPELDYVAVIHTSRGPITVDLYEDMTPETVNNFVFLALNRYYDGVPFHRVIENFMAQTGDPTGTGTGGPGYQFDDEIVEGLEFDDAGILAMANAGPGTNGSQFFITFEATPWLTGAHTIFGHVMEGHDVLPLINRVDPSQPSAVVPYSGTVGELAEQGVELPLDDDVPMEAAIEELLGGLPGTGQSFSVAGYRGVAGMLGTEPAFGFFLTPDEIESVVIAARPR